MSGGVDSSVAAVFMKEKGAISLDLLLRLRLKN